MRLSRKRAGWAMSAQRWQTICISKGTMFASFCHGIAAFANPA
jgi:hypothetical protein